MFFFSILKITIEKLYQNYGGIKEAKKKKEDNDIWFSTLIVALSIEDDLVSKKKNNESFSVSSKKCVKSYE